MPKRFRRRAGFSTAEQFFRVWSAAAIALILCAVAGPNNALAQEEKSSIGDLLPAIIKSLGKKTTDLTRPLKKALEEADKSNASTFKAPAFPVSPGPAATIAPITPAPPAISDPRARAIHTAQGHLNRLGFNAGTVDGKMRPKTRKAIKAFQASRGTRTTGRVSTALLKALGESVEQAKVSESADDTTQANQKSNNCVIPRTFRATLKGVQPIGASSYRRIKPGRYRVMGKQALGTPGRKHYVRTGDVVDVQFSAKKSGWRTGGPVICQDGVAIGVAYRGRGFFAGNGKKRVFVLLPKGQS